MGILNSAFELQLLPASPSSEVQQMCQGGKRNSLSLQEWDPWPTITSLFARMIQGWSTARTEPGAGFLSPIKLGSDELGFSNTAAMALPGLPCPASRSRGSSATLGLARSGHSPLAHPQR